MGYLIVGHRYFWYTPVNHETPSLILWEILEALREDVRPTYQYANEEG